MLFLSCFLLTLLPLELFAQIGPINGTCPFVPPQHYFEMKKAFGVWYEYARYIPGVDKNSSCTIYKFEETFTPKDIKFAKFMKRRHENELTVSYSWMTMLGSSTLRASKTSLAHKTEKGEYTVIGSDYDRFLILYHCEPNQGNSHRRFIYILTRFKVPDEITKLEIKRILSESKLIKPKTKLVLTHQDDCPSQNVFIQSAIPVNKN